MEKLHNVTATVCRDMHRSEFELRDPWIRRWIRLLLIVAVGALLVVAIVVMALRVPQFQTDKITFSSQINEAPTLQKLLAEGVQKNQTINCPCRKQVMSWCEITTFHVYTATALNASQPFKEALTLTKDDGSTNLTTICYSRDDELRQHICESVLSPVINSKDSRTGLSTGSVYAHPDLLHTEITTRIDTNEYEQSNNYNYLASINQSELYNYSDGLIDLLRKMASQFQVNSSSSAQDFWNASAKIRTDYPALPFGFGMDVNWTAYLQNCDPPFCDVEYHVSALNRALRAMGQVGGVTTIVSLALKFLLWPLLRYALNFSATPDVPPPAL